MSNLNLDRVIRKACPLLIGCSKLLVLAALVSFLHAQEPQTLNRTLPLGMDSIEVENSGSRPVTFMGTLEIPEFEGAKLFPRDESRPARLIDRRGRALEDYPRKLQFRVTATAKSALPTGTTFPHKIDESLNDFLLGLRFRLKAFDALKVQTFEPASVKLIGVPKEIAHAARTYRVSFNVGELPLERRLVLEILDPEEQRATRFHVVIK